MNYRRIIVSSLAVCAAVAATSGYAQDRKAARQEAPPVVTAPVSAPRAFSAVGIVEYVDFNKKGQSVVAIKDKDGVVTEVVLDNIKKGSQMLATYRKEPDAKGKENNVAVTLSIIRPAE